jgi:hypothetical protein
MTLLPVLPIADGEALTSYLGRVGRFHLDLTSTKFLNFIQLASRNIHNPSQMVLERIANLTGVPAEQLSDHVIFSVGNRARLLRGEAFHAGFVNFTQTTYCPACLLDDGSPHSQTGGLRFARILWRIDPIRACRRHNIALVRHRNASSSDEFQDMTVVAPDDAGLEKLVRAAKPLKPSGLQDYVENRLNGGKGPAWLDEQQIDQAARACLMLGAVLTRDNQVELSSLDECARAEAEVAGFDSLSRGPEGVRSALQSILENAIGQTGQSGPQHAFGKLYQWLQFKKGNRPTGPIADVTRDFILDRYPVGKGTVLFGQPVKACRVHSVESLARETGADPRTINRVAIAIGLMTGDPTKVDSSKTFDATVGELMVQRFQDAILIVDLHKYLNCTTDLAQHLVQSKLIPRLFEGSKGDAKVLRKVAIDDAQSFLEKLTSKGDPVEVGSDGMVNISTASRMSRCSVFQITEGILQSRFRKVEIVNHELRFQAVLVDPTEVRETLHQSTVDGHITLQGAAEYLNMKTYQVSRLTRIVNGRGVPYLSRHYVKKGRKPQLPYFCFDEVQSFKRRFTPLVEYAKVLGQSPKVTKEKLDGQGIEPIAPKDVLTRYYYRRAELPEVA